MRNISIVRFMQSAAFNCITVVILVMSLWADIRASDDEETLSCTISPNNGATAVGIPVNFRARVRDGDHSSYN